MAMVVKNNMSAVSTLNTLNKNSSALQKSLAKVSSGMKINSAQDDASGYAISEKMRVQIRSLDQANQNTQNASSLMKTAEGAVSSTVEILKSLKEKAINAATDTNTDADRATIQKELDQFIDQIDDNALTTFNGKYLVDGSKSQEGQAVYTRMTNQSLQVGTNGQTQLTKLYSRNNESLEIEDTDYVTASFVKDGKTFTEKYKVGTNTLDDVFKNLNALAKREVGSEILSGGTASAGGADAMSLDEATGIVANASNDDLKAIADGSTTEGDLVEAIKTLYSTKADGTEATSGTDDALTSGLSDAVEGMNDAWLVAGKVTNQSGNVAYKDYKGADKTINSVNPSSAAAADYGDLSKAMSDAVQAWATGDTAASAGVSGASSGEAAAAVISGSVKMNNNVVNTNIASEVGDTSLHTKNLTHAALAVAAAKTLTGGGSATYAVATTGGVDTDTEITSDNASTYIMKHDDLVGMASKYDVDISAATDDKEIAAAIMSDIIGDAATSSGTSTTPSGKATTMNEVFWNSDNAKYTALEKDGSNIEASYNTATDTSKGNITLSNVDFVVEYGDGTSRSTFKADKVWEDLAAVANHVAAQGVLDSAGTDDGKGVVNQFPEGTDEDKAKTGFIGLNSAGDAVFTGDGTEGLTVTAAKAGIQDQIASITISITDSEGNVKKSANAALDQFKTSIFGKNESVANEMTFQVGAAANQSITVGLNDMRSEALGLKGSDGSKVSVATQDKANAAVAVFDNALSKAIDQQTTIGAVEARLDYTSQNLTTMSENTQAAESTIRDADMAKEMTNYTKNNVLLQAAQSMLAQANQSSSQVLSLLQ